MKIVSFNINSIRARPHQLSEVVKRHQPDIIGLQETKVQDSEFPAEILKEFGYSAIFYGQKGHYGAALFYRLPLVKHSFGFAWDPPDAQRRAITATFELPGHGQIHVFNGYFPQGESRHHEVKFPYKRKFYQDLYRFFAEQFDGKDRLVVMGDMNVSPQDIDIGIGEENRKRWLATGKCSFLPEEREWYEKILSWGLYDSFRQCYPEVRQYSWYDYRSRGFERNPRRGLRIDHILISEALLENCRNAGIDLDIRGMEKPSDHCPVWTEFEF